MQKRVKLGIGIAIYISTMILVSVVWLSAIKQQRMQKSGQLKIQILRPTAENILIDDKDIKETVLKFYKKDWRKIKSFAMNTVGLESRLEALPVVHHSEIYLDANQNLHVDVYQRDPVLRVLDIEGNQYYIDTEGNKIPCSSRYAARVPVVTGVAGTQGDRNVLKGKNLHIKNIYYLALEIAKDPFAQSLIEQIDIQQTGDVVFVPKIGSEKIFFGKVNDIQEKLDKLQFFYREGLRYEGWNVYTTIDLQNRDQVVCKRNNAEL
ncbi:MAG: hypothetical protein IPH93_06445 [Saprospiraceae bacterium]|nr:hypothetical protein [Saprospiraceae bacterium]MBK7811271.1 hypothetical protein [Saprospiraceae bacterium]